MTDFVFDKRWDWYFLREALTAATMSKDPSTKVGAVIVRPNRTICSKGWNGLPKQIADDEQILADRDKKYPRVIHAEMNAILSAREPIDGYHIYVWPVGPCLSQGCAKHVVQAGISRVVFPEDLTGGDFEPYARMRKDHDDAIKFLRQAGVDVKIYDILALQAQGFFNYAETQNPVRGLGDILA